MRVYCFVQFLCFRASFLDVAVRWTGCFGWWELGCCWDSLCSEVDSQSNSLMSVLQDQPVLGASQPKLSFPCSQSNCQQNKGAFCACFPG